MTTIAPTVDELQQKIAKLRQENDDLVDMKLDLESQLADALDREREANEGDVHLADRARQAVIDHHDEARHRGSVRFCTEAPCPALNALLADGDLL